MTSVELFSVLWERITETLLSFVAEDYHYQQCYYLIQVLFNIKKY